MTVEIRNMHGRDITVIRADEGKVFRRKHDGFVMGNELFLGNDYSLGYERVDLPEYYEEIEEPVEEIE